MAFKLSLFLGGLILLLGANPLIAHSHDTKHPGLSFAFLNNLKEFHKGQNVKGLHDLKRYLENFGYLNYGSSKKTKLISNQNYDEFDDLLESAIKQYQSNYNLKVTGNLDSETIREMMIPRCGVPDIVNGTNTMSRKKMKNRNNHHIHTVRHFSFFPNRPRWPPSQTHLTYQFRSTATMPVGIQELRSICSRAFKRWQDVSHFTFEEAQGASSDIEIGFHRGSHGDGSAFDGPGSVLAHAFAPTGGMFHYDADENWSPNPSSLDEVDLESVAVHEIGHLLGLGHSSVQKAVMFAQYAGGIRRDLNSDDIEGIRTLYSLN